MNEIFDSEKLEEKISLMRKTGANKLHILADFDRTLTLPGQINGKSISSTIGQLRATGSLAPNYASASYKLFEKYGPLEHDQSIPLTERTKLMKEWWTKHIELLIESRLNKSDMDEIAERQYMKLREGVHTFFEILNINKIPLVIMSGGPGYMIQKQLEFAGVMNENVYIVANWYEYDENGYMINYKKPIIHSLNKYEIILREFPFFEQIKERTNVILLGDQIDDLGMIQGFDYENLLTIGISTKPSDEKIYASKFDVVITDNKFNFINNILNKIL